MEIIDTIYTQADFKQACAALLPPGEYWQYQTNSELEQLLEAMGTEFKTIHDETKLNPLYQENNSATGWKLSDYQSILNSNEIAGLVTDNALTPNLIYITFEAGQMAGDLMKQLDSYRLPHTAFCCTYAHQQTLHIAICRQTLHINRRTLRAL